jgi:hypothetical protein
MPKKLRTPDRILATLDLNAAHALEPTADTFVEQAVHAAIVACRDFDDDLGKLANALLDCAMTLDDDLDVTDSHAEAWEVYRDAYAFGCEHREGGAHLAESGDLWWPEEIPQRNVWPVTFLQRLGCANGAYEKLCTDELRRMYLAAHPELAQGGAK